MSRSNSSSNNRPSKVSSPGDARAGANRLCQNVARVAGDEPQRRRLVRLCAKLSGADAQVAEDLAQEALVEAWRNAHGARTPEAPQAWLHGVARNVCLRWRRQQGRELARTAVAPVAATMGAGSAETSSSSSWLDSLAGEPIDFTAQLERDELADLLDKAMTRLSPPDRELLVQRYVNETPIAEIAARLGLSENAAGVRLHRGRLALRRVLSTSLRDEAAVLGLVAPADAGAEAEADGSVWQQTRIWCPRCGEHHLEACYQAAGGAGARFGTRCPGCGPWVGFDFTTDHAALDPAQVLGPVRAYKPALRRVHAWWNGFYQQAVTQRQAPCLDCGGVLSIGTTARPDAAPSVRAVSGKGGLFFVCTRCGRRGCAGPNGLALMRPETQQFWRRHGRIRGVRARLVAFAERPAVAVGFESVTARAVHEVILDRETLHVLHVSSHPPGE